MPLTHPFLMFSMHLDEMPLLNWGRLFLIDYEKGMLGRWQATSGLGAYQRMGDWSKQGGGVLPAPYNLKSPIPNYWVQVEPVDLSHVKGIQGNGYPIAPFSVITKDGVERSDVLIHADENAPGTLGCIGILKAEWGEFEKVFAKHCTGIDRVRLYVGYTY